MGRHGGGSRSGGSHRSSSSGRSSGGSRGSGTRTSSTPFTGCYNRSYYDRSGRLHSCYTSNKAFGTKSGWSFGVVFALIFITFHMLIMVGAFGFGMTDFGSKVSGDPARILLKTMLM